MFVRKLLCLSLFTVALHAQQPRVYTAADYAQAEKFMSYNTDKLVLHSVDKPAWLADGRFWYRDQGADGFTYLLVDPAKKTKAPAFDHAKLAAALTSLRLAKKEVDPKQLPALQLALKGDALSVKLSLGGKPVTCALADAIACIVANPPDKKLEPGVASPDGRRSAFIRDWNLWVRDTATGAETQLTRDGMKDYGYATDNAGWSHSDRAILVWSPDSKQIATFQQDQRKTGELYLTNTTNGHPTLTTLKYPLVGDENVTMIERVVIDVDAKRTVRLKMPPDQHRSTICDDVACRGVWDDVQWSADSRTLGFVSSSRDHKQAWMRVADVKSGAVREVMNEVAPKFFESGDNKVNWRYLPASNELLWFSERDDWGQLYLYDLTTGKLKNQITAGEGNVTQVLSVDEKNRVIYFLAVGKVPSVDPYFEMFYRVDFDGRNQKLLTPEPVNHQVTLNVAKSQFVDVLSSPTQPQETVVRDMTGEVLMAVAHQDIARLKASGWTAPVPIEVKGRDGLTDLYGMLFKPSNFSTDKVYPIVDVVYPGPQTGSCGTRQFMAAHRDSQSLAELGFIVVCIDGMGTPNRSKSFHEAYYGNLGDNTIPDQVAGIRQLAERYPWIDIDRVGIWGHSGGGNATAAAMFHYPDFFKVGIAESGNHDNRDYEDDWAEKWAGLVVKNADGTSNYDSQANQNSAQNLKGHLLLAHGTLDDNVPPSNTLLLVDALIKANKDFDLIMIPNVRHAYGPASQYMTRRRWDYFVRYLAGGTPPVEYKMTEFDPVAAAAAAGPDDAGEDDMQP
ncbi:S9 family peptidase [Granulicella rosea]|nr:S9 family peptidase [Granulicella rosea]